MLTVELKINGKTIGTIDATRRPELDDGDTARYWTHMHHDETSGVTTVRTQFITHKPADGAWELVRKIITDPATPRRVETAAQTPQEPWHGKTTS